MSPTPRASSAVRAVDAGSCSHDQGDDVSSHADTIRAALSDHIAPALGDVCAARIALDALLAEREWVGELNKALNLKVEEQAAENQRLTDEIARQLEREPYLELTQARAENQRLREALEQAMGLADDAPLSVNDHDLLDQIHELIGEALAGDAE